MDQKESFVINKNMRDTFGEYLKERENAAATIEKYLTDIRTFYRYIERKYGFSESGQELEKGMLLGYKEWLSERYALTSANSMIAALNQILEFAGAGAWKLKRFRIQNQCFRAEEREMSEQEYHKLRDTAQAAGKQRLAMLVETIASTGIRVSLLSGKLLHMLHFFHFPCDQTDRYDECDAVRCRTGKENAVKSEEQRQDEHERNEKDDLPCHGEQQSLYRFPDSGKEIGRNKLHSVENNHKKENPHKSHRKFKVSRITCAEQGDDLIRKELEEDKSDCGDTQICCDGKFISLPHSVILPGAVIETDDRLGTLRDSDNDSKQDRVCFHHDAAGGERNFFPVYRHCAVAGQ